MLSVGHGAIPDTPIEDDDLRRRILHAVSAMPYSANTHLMQLQSIGTAGASGCTLEALADWLEAMGEVLREHAAECDAAESKRSAQARDIRATARIVDLVLGESKTVCRLLALAELARDELDGISEGRG